MQSPSNVDPMVAVTMELAPGARRRRKRLTDTLELDGALAASRSRCHCNPIGEVKAKFECPKEHPSALIEAIPQIDRILVIGWQATEEHFL
jgi:hypothetical protein